jgi:hypothetical protein
MNATRPSWPAPDPLRGRALTAVQAEQRLGVTENYVHVRLKRARDGKVVRVAWPEPDGRAIPKTGYKRLTMYWWEATVVAYGRAMKLLDGQNRPKTTSLKRRSATR